MGTDPKGCFLGGMGRRSLVFFKALKRRIFLIFQGIILLAVWDGVFAKSRWIFFFHLFFFCVMVT